MFTVTALYKFVTLDNLEELKTKFLDFCNSQSIKGTILFGTEGINGTIAGTEDAIRNFHNFLKSDSRFADIDHKESPASSLPFQKMKVKIKKEIVTIGSDKANPNVAVGKYVTPKEWNEIISQEDVIVIDTRNDYEYEIGTFKGAKNPNTKAFREFPAYVENTLDPKKHKKVAMFCTGGIRCEKASAFMLQSGFEEVYHLKGGILKYLEEVPEKESLWDGECYVFDQRTSVKHGLLEGNYVGQELRIATRSKEGEGYQV